MSQIHLEPIGFPWIPILITFVTIVLLVLIGKWVFSYGMWMYGNLKWSGPKKKPKKKTPPRKQKDEEEEEDEGRSDESD